MEKLIIVSIWNRGRRTAFLTTGRVGVDGKTRISRDALLVMLAAAKVSPGSRYCIGM